MRTVLVIVTEGAKNAAALLEEPPGVHVETIDLRQGDPDYNVLLDKIFEAESVQIW